VSNNSKGFTQIIIPIMLAVIAIVGIGYWAYKNGQIRSIPSFSPTPTPNSTANQTPNGDLASRSPNGDLANWKDYINTKYYYSVKYPENWIYKELSKDYVYFNPQDVSDNDQSISIKVTNSKSVINPVIAEFETVRDITLNGQKIEIKKYKSGSSVYRYVATFKNQDDNFTFGFSRYTDNKYEPYFDQILSTFKFLEKKCKEGESLNECKLGPCCCPIGADCD